MIAKWKLGSGFLAGLFPSWPQLEMDLSSSSFVTNGSFVLKLTRLSFRSRWLTSVLGWALFLRGLRVRRWKCATIHLFRGQCGFQGNLFAFASVTNLCSLVLDRYVAVTKPLQYLTFMKRRRVILMVSLSWAIPIALIASFGIELFVAQSFLDILICILMIFELLPSLMLIFCFVSMLKVVFKHNRAARSLAKQLRFNHRVFVQTQEKSAIIMMGIVIGLFLVCYGLYFRCSFLLVFKRYWI